MNSLRSALVASFLREIETFQREIELFPDDQLVWSTLPGIANSGGNLALHAAGNLQHFVGAVLGGTGYVRDRDAEFTRREGTRAELVEELERAARDLDRVLSALSEAALERDYPLEFAGKRLPTGAFLTHLLSHLAHHLGQIGYLRRVLASDSRSAEPVSIVALQARMDATARGG